MVRRRQRTMGLEVERRQSQDPSPGGHVGSSESNYSRSFFSIKHYSHSVCSQGLKIWTWPI
jgi:hypothetical protein